MTLIFMASASAYSATLNDVVNAFNAVLQNQEFAEEMGKNRAIQDLKIEQIDSTIVWGGVETLPSLRFTVNEKAPLTDGCSVSIETTSKNELFAVGPATTGSRVVVTASDVTKKCGAE